MYPQRFEYIIHRFSIEVQLLLCVLLFSITTLSFQLKNAMVDNYAYSTKNTLSKSVSLFIVLMFFVGCSVFYTKDKYIDDFTSFVKDVRTNCASYSDDDWTNADAQFDIYAVQDYEKFQNELTSEQKFAIGKLKGTYSLLKLKKGASDFMEGAKDVLDQAGGFIKGITDTINK